jgi:hypothetical protein
MSEPIQVIEIPDYIGDRQKNRKEKPKNETDLEKRVEELEKSDKRNSCFQLTSALTMLSISVLIYIKL